MFEKPITLKNEAQRFPARGVNVRRLDHFNCLALDVRACREFFARNLGLRCNERIEFDSGEEVGMWLASNNKSYDLAWTEAERSKGQAWGLKTIATVHTRGTPPLPDTGVFSPLPPTGDRP